MGPLKLSRMISEQQIQDRIVELGKTLTEKFKGEPVIAVCVLKGSFIFFSDLIREIDTDLSCEFLGLSSYGNSASSSGEVRMTLDLHSSVRDQNILIIEDIVDTGLTMQYLQQMLELRGAKSVTTVTLLHKPHAKKVECKIDYMGFEIPNDFVVGYGLDYQGMYRNLSYIAQVQNMN